MFLLFTFAETNTVLKFDEPSELIGIKQKKIVIKPPWDSSSVRIRHVARTNVD